jgi:lambda family phage portal protein
VKPGLLQRLGSALAARLGFVSRGEALSIATNAAAGAYKRGYSSAATNRLTSDWTTAVTSGDAELRGDLAKLRARARQLERDDDYARRYLKLLLNNVLGHRGVQLQMQVSERNAKGVLVSDTIANHKIEEAWANWGAKRNCSVTGNRTLRQVQKLVLRELGRDGSALILVHRGWDNAFKFALQVLEGDHLDYQYELNGLPGGNYIRFGIEFTPIGKPVAYHILTNHPGDIYLPYGSPNVRYRTRIPAYDPAGSEPVSCLHLFRQERASQSEGVTWMNSTARRLNMLGGFEEAVLVAARAAACKMGFLQKKTPETWTGETDGDGNKQMEAEPGIIEELPMGMEFKEWDPKYPTTGHNEYVKGTLRGAAAGLGVSYTALANDLEGVNYSSIRAGLLEEREEWKDVQADFIDDFLDPIFEGWLPMAILAGQLNLPMAKLAKFQSPEWKARRWPWVDPLKDLQADELAMKIRVKSRRDIIAEEGGDEEDTLQAIKDGEELEKHIGLTPVVLQDPLPAKAAPPSED